MTLRDPHFSSTTEHKVWIFWLELENPAISKSHFRNPHKVSNAINYMIISTQNHNKLFIMCISHPEIKTKEHYNQEITKHGWIKGKKKIKEKNSNRRRRRIVAECLLRKSWEDITQRYDTPWETIIIVSLNVLLLR